MSGLGRRLGLLVLVGIAVPAACSMAEGGGPIAVQPPLPGRAAPGQAATAKECAPATLPIGRFFMPARSWRALTAHLSSHFGEDASLDAATTASITSYLVANAGDGRYGSRQITAGLTDAAVPERITDMPWWRRAHRRLVDRGAAAGNGIRTAANCQTCHGANGGGDDD